MAAGVSVSSASRVMSGRGEFGAGTRARVIAAAEQLGYERSATTRGRPRNLDTRLVELVLGTFSGSWTDAVVRGAREAAFRVGYDLALTLERDEPEDDWPARVATRRPSGIILGVITPTTRQLDQLRGLRIPIVLLDPRSDVGGDLPSIGTTDWRGGYDAGVHLASTGIRRFLIVTGAPQFRFGRARETGFRQAIAEYQQGAVIDRVTTDWELLQVTSEFFKPFVEIDERLGVFALSDDMAFIVYRVVDALGLSIPDDVSIVGFDDVERAARMEPPLTSIRQPVTAIAARAVEMVHAAHSGEEVHERIELPSQLVVRESSRATNLTNPG
ncbi:LacI family DNA-binding transcriptional regulator [Microbacterium sp. LWS13-1.2]|uniref:LacI family DNA-binding transcriptional regulator n=1 Tax=Microbacterium sp. LWS13-1.2 TaxID=3135264 RepID=A0AAU6SAV9_9MICO